MSEIRVPTQKRSIEKRNKILEAGYKLFSENGYFNTDTKKIAAEAGVSTGIVYSYFKDKDQILIESLKVGFSKLLPYFENKIGEATKDNLKDIIKDILDASIAGHRMSPSLQKEFSVILANNEEFHDFYNQFTNQIIHRFCDILKETGFRTEHIHERMHIAFQVIESTVHEIAFRFTPCIDDDALKDEVQKIIYNLFI